jgi:C-terminal processing protease CtpA/Prc
VLKRFVVTFDYDNSTMYLKPYEGLHSDIDTFDRSGMWINAVPEGFKVIDITKGGPAEAAGLAKDDVITAIDGKPAADMNLPLVREMWRNWKPGTIVRLSVKGKGDVQVTLRDLI